ncbi:MAG: hypothetical protein P8L85_09560 [Rubripirellula sp.]|nr:hypothetical protein [Rubripirellula sp.]
MNCDRFDQRMNVLLDNHQSIADDSVLQSHVSDCDSCRQKMMIWQQIDSIGSSQQAESSNRGLPWSRLSALAAGLLIAVLLSWGFRGGDMVTARVESTALSPQQGSSEARRDSAELQQQVNRLDPSRWWESVEPQQWIAQTMPTVRTVQESVAPLSRSFKQAVEILTFGRAI